MKAEQKEISRLLKACKEGNATAQFDIYKLYYKAMFNTSLRIVQNGDDAEDIMQEAFLSAFSKIDTYRGEVPFGAWLKRIVINKSLTFIKKKNRLNEVNLEVVDHKLESENEGVDIESEIDYASIKIKQVKRAMEKLKDNYRMVLNLSLIEGYDNQEIAEIMNISNENCRTTISRAKSRLRALLVESSILN